MNHTFKTVWNRIRGCYVAVNEAVSGAAQGRGASSSSTFRRNAGLFRPALNLVATACILALHPLTTQAAYVAGITWAGANTSAGFAYNLIGSEQPLQDGKTDETRPISLMGSVSVQKAAEWVLHSTFLLDQNGGGGDSVNNAGTLTFEKGGNLIVNYKAWLTNTGSIVIKKGASFTFTSGNHSVYNSGIFNSTDGTFNFSSGPFTNSGTLYLGALTNWSNGAQYISNAGTLYAPLPLVATTTIDPVKLNVLTLGSNRAATTISNDIWSDSVTDWNPIFQKNATLNQGSVVHITTKISPEQANIVAALFQQQFPHAKVIFDDLGGTSNTAGYKPGHAFDAALINALLSAGTINWTYYDRDFNGDVNVASSGDEAKTIKGNIGFRSVKGQATVGANYTLELVGDNGKASTLATGAVIAHNGTLNLGTQSPSYNKGTVGTLENLTNAGTVNLHNGTFTLGTYTGQGNITADNKTTANWRSFRADAGTLNNAGKLNFNQLSRLQNVVNTGTLTFVSDLELEGTLNNAKGTVVLQDGLNFGVQGQFANADGTLQTAFGNLFDQGTGAEQAPLHTISLTAQAPESVKETLTDLFTRYLPGTVKQAVLDHMTFADAGRVIITDVKLTQTQRDDLTKAFAAAFGNKTTLVFQDASSTDVSRNMVLNTATVNTLHDAGIGLDNAIYVDRNWEGENAAAVLGADGIKHSVGFAGVTNAPGITVKDGLNLVLIGATAKDGTTPYVMTDALTTVKEKSTLTLGSLGLADTYSGKTAAIDLRGGTGAADQAALQVVAGNYLTGDVLAENGNITVAKGSQLTTGDVSFVKTGSFVNHGTAAVAGDLAAAGTNSSLSVTNYGDFSVSGTTSIIGSFVNQSQAKAHLHDVNVNGTLTNMQNGFLEANTMQVLGQLVNEGKIEAKETSSVYGTLTNNGVIRLYDTDVGNRGKINNTYTLNQTGTTTVQGLLSNVKGATANLEKLVLDGPDAVLENTGVLVADSLTLTNGAYAINGRQAGTTAAAGISLFAAARAAAGTEILRNLSIANGSLKTNAGTGYYGTGTIAGDFITAAGDQTFMGISTELVDGKGITIAQTGKLTNGGTTTFGGALTNAGTITGGGTVIFEKQAAGTNIFVNSGTLDLGTLQAQGITYNQTDGSLKTQKGWFANATVNQTGGTMAHAELDSGNTYNLGADGNANGTALFNVGTLSSDSAVFIRQGSTLHADQITMTGDKTTHLIGGTLGTTLNQIFDNVSYDAHDIDAQDPNDKVQISGVKIATGVGNVIDSVRQGIEFNWGTVAFDDATYSAALAADALTKLDAIDNGTPGKNLEVAFNGKAEQNFSVDLANKVVASKDGTSTYATFVNETLTNKSAAQPSATILVMGSADAGVPFAPIDGTANVLTPSMGFQKIVGAADGVYVNSSHHLVLVGAADNPDLVDGTLVVGGLAADSNVNSLVTLGSYATVNPTKGHIAEAYVGVNPRTLDQGVLTGTMQVRHGEFTIDKLHNGGLLQVGGDGKTLAADRTAVLTVGTLDLVSASDVQNDAVLNVTTLSSHTGTGNHSVHNNQLATLTLGTGDLNGVLYNAGTMTADSLTLRMSGSEVSSTGKLTAKALTVAGDSTWGTGGTARGSLVNTGSISATTLKVQGDFTNENEVAADTFQVDAQGKATNSKTVNADNLVMAQNSTLINTAKGVFSIAGAKEVSTVRGALDNAGTLKVNTAGKGLSLAANGTLTNSGTYEGALSIAGGVYTNTGTSKFENLTITAGKLVNSSGSVTDSGATNVNLSDKNAVAIDNAVGATLGFGNLTLTSGVIQGGSVGTAQTVAKVLANGTITNASGLFSELTNAGMINLSDLTVGTTLANSGKVTIAGTTTVTGLNNAAVGTVTLKDGVLTNSTNAGTITASGSLTASGTNAGTVTVADTGSFTVAKDQSYGNSKDLTVSGSTTVAGTLSSSGNLNLAAAAVEESGTLSSSGTSKIDALTLNSGSQLAVSGGTTTVQHLVADSVTYNQTGGALAAAKGWFTNSTLNISGGSLNAADLKDDQGNALGSLGKNVINISGPNTVPAFNDDDPADQKAHYKDNLTVVTADTLTSDTSVNVLAGGVLDVEHLHLTQPGNFKLAGGVLQTSTSEIFSWVKTQAIKIDAKDPETGTVVIPTQVLASTTVGEVKDSVKANAAMESGMIAFDDAWFSASTLVSSAIQFGKAFTEGAKNITLHFLGSMQAPFTVDTAKELEDEGLPEVLAGIVLDTTTLHNETHAAGQTNKELAVGGTADGANTINISMGFQNAANTDKVTVLGGKEFALVGDARPADFDWQKDLTAGSHQLLTDAADGGSVKVTNSTFTFGSDGTTASTVGWINSSAIDTDGKVVVKNGEFADWTLTNDGTLQVNANGVLHTNSYTGAGTGTNAGTFDVDGTFDVAAGAGFTNTGKIDAADTADTTVRGKLTNAGTAVYDDMTVKQGGVSENSGKETGDILHLTDSSSHVNTGTSIWNNVDVAAGGTMTNGKELAAGDKKGHEEGFVSTGGLKLGTDAPDESTTIAGVLNNHGTLDAGRLETVTVTGTVTNYGRAGYDDMIVAAGGKSDNAGFEQGDQLHVAQGGTHANTGVSIWNNLDLDQGGSTTNGTDLGDAPKGYEDGFKPTGTLVLGTQDNKETVVIQGDLMNHGVLNAENADTAQVAGTVTNDGQAKYDDMTIVAGGKSDNAGFEQGDILTVQQGGTHTNSGVSIWNNAQVEKGGSVTNGAAPGTGPKGSEDGWKSTGSLTLGTDAPNETTKVAGDLTNHGTLDATKSETVEVSGTVTNTGRADYDDMTVASGGKSDNSGYEKGDILTVGGTHENTGEAHWNNVVAETGGTITNKGDLDTGKVTLNGGTIEVHKGTINSGSTDFSGGGDLVVGNFEPLDEANKATVNLKGTENNNANIWVIGNGALHIGEGADKFGDEMGAPKLPDTPARLTVTETVHVGGGSIAVGTETYKSDTDKLAMDSGDLFFGKDSYTLVDAGAISTTTPAFTTTTDDAKVTVEQGATLVLGNIQANGDYLLTDGFLTAGNTTDGTWTGGWTADHLYALPLSNTGIKWVLTLHNDPSKIWVTATLDDVRTVYPDIVIPENSNDSLNHGKKDNGGSDGFIWNTLSDPHLTKDDKTRQINSVAMIGSGSGALETAFGDISQTTDAVEDRLSFKGEHFTHDGLLRRADKGASLWVDVLGGWKKTKNREASGSMEGGHKNDSYGFILGSDYVPASGHTTFGAAFAYTDGSVKSNGDWLPTSTETKSCSLTGYGSWTPNEKVNVSGSVTVQKGSADATQTMLGGGFREATASIDTTLAAVAVKAEYRKAVGKAVVVPHAGIRAVYAKTAGYDTKVDGDKVFSNSIDNATQVQFPIGVAIRGEFETRKGWKIRPTGDLSFTAITGDTEQTTTVAGSRGVTDAVTGEFSGRFVTSLNLGLQAEKGSTTIGIGLGVNKGDGGRQDNNVKVQLRHAF